MGARHENPPGEIGSAETSDREGADVGGKNRREGGGESQPRGGIHSEPESQKGDRVRNTFRQFVVEFILPRLSEGVGLEHIIEANGEGAEKAQSRSDAPCQTWMARLPGGHEGNPGEDAEDHAGSGDGFAGDPEPHQHQGEASQYLPTTPEFRFGGIGHQESRGRCIGIRRDSWLEGGEFTCYCRHFSQEIRKIPL